MSGLRDELLSVGKELPALRLLLPAGWRASPLQQAGVDELVRRLRATLMAAHRPDVDAYLTGALRRWIGELRAAGGLYMVLPVDPPGGTPLPMSLVVSVVTDAGGQSVESWVVEKIRSGTTEFLDENRTVLTWTTTTPGRDEMAGTVSDRFDYMIPVPGTSRRSALVLSGTNLSPDSIGADDPRRVAAHTLFDSIALAADWVLAPAVS